MDGIHLRVSAAGTVLLRHHSIQSYDRYWADTWNVEAKKLRHEKQFPIDLQQARQLGRSMVKSADF